MIGAPISGLLLGMDGFMGMKGWQWLFILEAIPALILSVVVFFYLTDRPADATWLEPDERAWLAARLQQERTKRETVRHYSVAQALLNPKVLALSLVYFGAVATNYGLSFFLPQIVKAFGVSNLQAGFITALPYVVGVVSIVWWGRHSDRTLERRYHLAFPLFVASAGIAISTMLDDPTMKMVALSIAGFGIFGCLPVFWTFPTAFLSGPAAAGGIALINSIGNLAGFAGPYAMGHIKDLTGSYTGGLLSLAAAGLMAMIIVLVARPRSLARTGVWRGHRGLNPRRQSGRKPPRSAGFSLAAAQIRGSPNDLLAFSSTFECPADRKPQAAHPQSGSIYRGRAASVQVSSCATTVKNAGPPGRSRAHEKRKTLLAVILLPPLLRTRRRARCFFSSGQFALHLQEGEEES